MNPEDIKGLPPRELLMTWFRLRLKAMDYASSACDDCEDPLATRFRENAEIYEAEILSRSVR